MDTRCPVRTRSSYSLYVTHYPFTGLACRHGRLSPEGTALALMAAVVIAAIGLALVFSWATEWRTVALRDWIERKLASSGVTVRAVCVGLYGVRIGKL